MDLATMMRNTARSAIQSRLDTATTAGDIDAVRKISDELAQFDVQTTPRAAVTYGDAEIKAELGKTEWFGADPKKTAKAMEFGKTMDPKKFAGPEAFAAAVIKAVDAEFAPPPPKEEEGEEEDDENADSRPPAKVVRKTDAPPLGDVRPARRSSSSTWEKLSDAPRDVQDDIKASVTRHVPSTASKEQREAFTKRALAAHQKIHQQKAAAK